MYNEKVNKEEDFNKGKIYVWKDEWRLFLKDKVGLIPLTPCRRVVR